MEVNQQLQNIISQIVTEYCASRPEEAVVSYSPSVVVDKAVLSQTRLLGLSLKQREAVIQSIRAHMLEIAPTLFAKFIDQTKMGNLQDKLTCLSLIIEKTPSLDDLVATVNTGDDGLTLNEFSPYGVIASVVPIHNLIETIVCQAIGMVASGNAVVFSVPVCVYKLGQEVVAGLNNAISQAGGPELLLGVLTTEQTQALVQLPNVDMVVITGDVDENLNIPINKKIILTGSAYTPVIVDETADIEQAAKDIVLGASFDHNLSVVSEKVLVTVESIADFLLHHLASARAYVIQDTDVLRRLESLLAQYESDPFFKGRSATEILALLGIYDQEHCQLIIVEIENAEHPFVQKDLMLPILPFLRAKNIEQAIEMAKKLEGGVKHTAIMHSKHIDHLTSCARALQVVLFVKNAPSFAGLGLGGEGFASLTIAAVTGEGMISAKHYSRQRRCVLSEGFLIK